MDRFHLKIAVLVLFALIFALGIFKIQGYDIWFHLKTGEYVLNRCSIPYSDPFSYTAAKPWIAHSWLAGVFYYIIYKVFSLGGLVIFNALIITLYLFLIFLVAKERGNTLTAVVFTFLAALAIRMAERFFLRPDVFTLLFASTYIYIFFSFKNRWRDAIYLIPLIELLWSNLHGGGAILGLGLIALYLSGEIAEFFFKHNRFPAIFKDRDIKTLVFVSASSFVLAFVNPYGWKVLAYFTHTWGKEFSAILEWRATALSDFLGPYGIIMVSAIVSIVLYFKRIRFSDVFLVLVLGYFSTRAIRLIPLAVLAACPVASFGLYQGGLFLKEKFTLAKKIPRLIVSIIIILLISISAITIIVRDASRFGSAYQFGLGINDDYYPVDAIRFVEEERLKGNMFNSYGFGGYLIWRFYPQRKVFVDGRFDIYGEDFIAKYRRFGFDKVWDELVKKYNLAFALLDNEPSYVCSSLDSDQDWALVFWDDRSLIYVRNLPQNREVINKYRYKYLKPNNRNLSYLEAYIQSPAMRNEVLEEIKRSFKGGRQSFNARLMLAYIYERMEGGYVKSIAEYKSIIAAIPDWGELYKRIGVLYLRHRRFKDAYPYLKKAVKLEPRDLEGHNSLALVYYFMGDRASAIRECRKALKINPYDQTALMNLKIFEAR